jgi:hypothetical protein
MNTREKMWGEELYDFTGLKKSRRWTGYVD